MTISSTQMLWFGVAVIVTAVLYFVKRLSSAPFLVRRWADDHGFRILHSEFRHFSKGPFSRKISHRGQEVYRVQVRDEEGRERSAWLRCRRVSTFTDDNIEVIWEDEL
jgi:hypothetical protein